MDYSRLEQHVVDLFNNEITFVFNNITYEIIIVGKPRPQRGGGECKTDVFIRGKNIVDSKDIIDIKLSIKTIGSNEFYENKIKAKRAEEIFGIDWEKIFTEAAYSKRAAFENSTLIYPEKAGRTQANSITLGWKGEITNKKRNLSSELKLSEKEMKDFVYKGINQPIGKKDAMVNGIIIEDSGIADYLLESEIGLLTDTDAVLTQMRLIDNLDLSPMYLAFTANNYRAIDYRNDSENKKIDGKTDGNRSLAVAIDWNISDSKLTPNYIYEEPLKYEGGKQMKNNLIESLDKLGKYYPDEFIREDVANYDIIVNKGKKNKK